MKKMSREECWQFMTARARTGKLATVRPDGRPHVVPVWFARDGEEIVFTTGANTAKATNMRHNPAVCLCVDDENPPFAYVKVDGTVTFSEDLEAMRHWATVIGGRYMGAAQAEAYGARNGVPGELLVRLTPARLFGEDDIAGW